MNLLKVCVRRHMLVVGAMVLASVLSLPQAKATDPQTPFNSFDATTTGLPGLNYGDWISVEEMLALAATHPNLHCLGRGGICFGCAKYVDGNGNAVPGTCSGSGGTCSAGGGGFVDTSLEIDSSIDRKKSMVRVVSCKITNSTEDFASDSLSYVDNTFYTYDHSAFDFPNVSGSPLSLQRFHRTRDFFKAGSFGRGVMCNFDLRLNLDGIDDPYGDNPEVEVIGYRWASLTVPNSSVKFNFEHVADTTFPPGFDYYQYTHNRLLPTQRSRAEKLEIFDAQMQPVVGEYRTTGSYGPPVFYPNAKFAKLSLWDGVEYVFELVNAEPSSNSNPSMHPSTGRLIEARDQTGVAYTVNYKTWTQAEIDQSPSRLWQIDTVTDYMNNTLTFEYAAQQQAGCWVISEVTLPDDSVVEYRYAGGLLSEVEYPDGSVSTVTYTGQSSGLVKIEFHDHGAAAQHRHKTVYVSGSVGTTGGTVVPTSVGMARLVVNGANEVAYANSANYDQGSTVATSVYGMIYEGGGRAFGELHAGSIGSLTGMVPRRYYLGGWTFEEGEDSMGNPGPYEFTGTLEDNYSMYVGGAANISVGQASRVIDEQGKQIVYTYDEVAPGRPHIRTDYADGTFETYCYNAKLQVIRYRDRKGHVTRHTYDSQGNLLSKEVGLVDNPNTISNDPYSATNYNRCATDDVQTDDYAITQWQYVPANQNGAGRLAKEIDPLGHETDYQYDSLDRLTKIQKPADSGSTRPEVTMTYDDLGRLQTVTDPIGHQVQYFYDFRHRLISALYDDGTSEKTIYGTTGTAAGLVAKTVDRQGVVTTYQYDGADRLTSKITAAAKIVDGNEVATPEIASEETYAYLNGTFDLIEQRRGGQVNQYAYDYRGRRVGSRQFTDSDTKLVSLQTYLQNKLFSTTDPYGRKTYYAYDATDGRLIRTVSGHTPEFALTSFQEVLNLVRDLDPNAAYSINDQIYDAEGNLVESYDTRLVKSEMEYDSRGRQTVRIAAVETAEEAKTETIYDAASNVVEVRSPRYFDTSDTEGSGKASETWTYNGRNLVATHTEAPGTPAAATESFIYDLDNRQIERTDFAGKVWKTHHDDCCGQVISSENPLGDGSISRKDPTGRLVHQVAIEDYSAHSGTLDDPVDAKTLREVTTKYDGRGRPVARTTWLVARGLVEVNNPPIAGLGSIPAADGLTEQYLYDDDLSDGVGLDSGTGILPVIASTGNVSLAAALSKLADTPANGGAGVAFDADAGGSAWVSIKPEGEIQFSISDAAGRSVMSGMLDDNSDLITWNCTMHDQTELLTGYGTVLVSQNVNALGHVSKSLSDAAGRTLQSIDALGKITSYEYDAAGNQLKVRDPNGVGQDCLYDALGRDISCTDTSGSVTTSSYDLSGNKIASTDAKSNATTFTFDARGRQVKQTDRLSGETLFAYTATSQLQSLTDAEGQVTSYTYDDAGNKLTEVYPDHVANSTIGQPGYGIVSFTPDATGRTIQRTDQQGDTCDFTYDLAGRLLSKAYTGHASGPLSGQSGTDSFTYDDASRMLTAVSGRYGNTVSYAYDEAGRQASESIQIGGQTYTTLTEYDAVGQVSKLTYPDGKEVERNYTDRGQLAGIDFDGTTIDTRTYDDGGRMLTSSYNNGVSETRAYNNDNTLASINFTGAPIGNLSYGWDANKNKTSEGITGTMSGYGFDVGTSGYDDEDRLVSWQRDDNNLDQSWNLSLVGDWNSITENASVQNRTHGPTHELLTSAGQAVQHDAKGNQTLLPAILRPTASSLAMKWDFENKLIGADTDNDSVVDVTYQWDALGRRVGRDDGTTATVFVQSGQQTIADYTSGAAAASPTYNYVYASYIDEPVMRSGSGGLVYYHRNQQYSITAITNGGGSITERFAYSAYGTPTIADASGTTISNQQSAIENRYTYTGREYDETLNLYHYRARMYYAGAGRFCSRDPIGYFQGNNSRYQYVRARPANAMDSYGLHDHEPAVQSCRHCKLNSEPIFQSKGCGLKFDESLGGWFFGGDFTLDVSYASSPDGNCGCCQFNQFVKRDVTIEVTFSDGRTETIRVPENGKPTYREDCIERNGETICYGSRDFEWEDNRYSKDGCSFHMRDTPGLKLTPWVVGLQVQNPVRVKIVMNTTFQQMINDKCNPDDPGREKYFNRHAVKCSIDILMNQEGWPVEL